MPYIRLQLLCLRRGGSWLRQRACHLPSKPFAEVAPTVMTDLNTEHCGQLIAHPLWRRCATLSIFSQASLGNALLSHSLTLGPLLKLRNDAREAELARETCACTVPAGDVDFAEAFGLEYSDSVHTKRRTGGAHWSQQTKL